MLFYGGMKKYEKVHKIDIYRYSFGFFLQQSGSRIDSSLM